jgi:hypothetical protein
MLSDFQIKLVGAALLGRSVMGLVPDVKWITRGHEPNKFWFHRSIPTVLELARDYVRSVEEANSPRWRYLLNRGSIIKLWRSCRIWLYFKRKAPSEACI